MDTPAPPGLLQHARTARRIADIAIAQHGNAHGLRGIVNMLPTRRTRTPIRSHPGMKGQQIYPGIFKAFGQLHRQKEEFSQPVRNLTMTG